MSSTVTVNPNRPMADAAGQPATFTTYEGDVLHGVTDVDSSGRLIVRFDDGRWAFASVEYVAS